MNLRAVRRTTTVFYLSVLALALVGWKCPGNPLVKPSFTGGPQSGRAPLYAQFQGDVDVLPPLVLAKFRGEPGDDEQPPPAPEPEPEPVTVVSWLWSFGDGASGTGQNVSHVYTDEGCHDVTLTVILSNGMSGTITREDFICVEVGNQRPVADAGPDQEVPVAVIFNKEQSGKNGQAGTLVQLDGSESYDPDGDPLTYSWTFIEWPEGLNGLGKPAYAEPVLSDPNAEKPTFVAELPGDYMLQLVVDDGQPEDAKVLSEPDTVTITGVVNSGPVADAGDDQNVCRYDETQLDGSDSFDPDGGDLTYSWSFLQVPAGSNVDDGWLSNPAATKPRFVPDVPGEFRLLLVVSDGVESAGDTVSVTAADARGFSRCVDFLYLFTQGPSQVEIDDEVASFTELPPFTNGLDVPIQMSEFEVTNCLFASMLNYANGEGYLDPPVKAFAGGNVTLNGEILLQIEDIVDEPEYCDIEWDDVHGIFFVARRDGQSMAHHPVVEVSWFGALAFCNWMSDLNGYDLMYNLATWSASSGSGGCRLPDENEWEYAAAWETTGVGTGQHHIWGFVSSLQLTDISTTRANYQSSNPLGLTAPPLTTPIQYYNGANGTTSSKSPSNLYDMSGNVAEWTNTEPYLYPNNETKGEVPDERIIRGGSWQDTAYDVRTARRDSLPPHATEPTVGFRFVWEDFLCGE
ncbi:MAG: hypothetical protein AMXMBFR82_32450 [Candidatus Hydrogenedentota bacterium]